MLTYGAYLADKRTSRCGIIPYIQMMVDGQEKLYFLLAKDRETGEFGDFGGGVKKKETSLEGGVREFDEESRGIFRDIYKSVQDFANKPAAVNGTKMAIVFAPVPFEWAARTNLRAKFVENTTTKRINNEIADFLWIDEQTFVNLISKGSLLPRQVHKDLRPYVPTQGLRLWKVVRSFFLKMNAPALIDALKKRRRAEA